MGCSLPCSSVHGILQVRILEWVAIPASKGSSQPREWTCFLCLQHLLAGSLPLVPHGRPQDIYMVYCKNRLLYTEIQLLTVNVWTNSREAVHNENTKVNFFFKYLALLSAPMGNGTPLQYSCLENPMDGGTWKAAVHGVAEAWTQLSDFTFTFNFHALENKMATHSSVIALRIPGTGEPGGLPSMGSHRVGHDWSELAAVAAADLNKDIHTQKVKQLQITYNETQNKRLSNNFHRIRMIHRILSLHHTENSFYIEHKYEIDHLILHS